MRNPGRCRSELAEERLRSAIESLLLVAGGPLAVNDLAKATGAPASHVRTALLELHDRLTGGVRLQLLDDMARYVTAPENDEVVRRYIGTERPPPLSRSVLETLTVVAYQQPVTRAEIVRARGANSDRQVVTLTARGLIEECGHRDVIGRPAEYRTTFAFLEYFGLGSLADLPPLPTVSTGYLHGGELGLTTLSESGERRGNGGQEHP